MNFVLASIAAISLSFSALSLSTVIVHADGHKHECKDCKKKCKDCEGKEGKKSKKAECEDCKHDDHKHDDKKEEANH